MEFNISPVPQHIDNININVRKNYCNNVYNFQDSKKENTSANTIQLNNSELLNYRINRFNNIVNNKNKQNNNLYKSNDNIIPSGSVFHKMKKEYYEFNPKPDIEEIPTFTFENDRNINNYKGNIYNKQSKIEKNSQNYLNYMKKFERKKTPLQTPYAVFQEITNKSLNINNYNNIKLNNNINNKKKDNSDNINNINDNNNINNTVNIKGIKKTNWNENYSNNYLHNNDDNLKRLNPLSNSISAKSLLFDNRKSEITNPDYFYKRNNEDYYKYRAEQKKYLDYNYQILKNKNKLSDKKEPNINPYNPKHGDFEHYKSNLPHNPILNPVNYYSYNKYLEKEIREIKNNNSEDNVYQNNNCINTNTNNKCNYSPFQKAGSQVLQ